MYLGAHVPTGGGLFRAPEHGDAIGAEAIQIFTRNQMVWACRALTDKECGAFRDARERSGVREVLVHGSYLMNLAGAHPEFLLKSRECFVTELGRCHRLGIRHLVFHPGAHMGAGEKTALKTLVESLDDALEQAEDLDVMPLLEVTAGQGTTLGHRFEHLATVLDASRHGERLGVCLDTCHLYAAGYDVATPAGWDRTVEELDRVVGLERVKAVHLNDSKRERGSAVDRHARAGEGLIGLAALQRIMNDPRLAGRPMVVETPGPLAEWKKEIARLRAPIRTPAARRRKRP